MKEEAKSGDYVLCRGMVVLILCALVLGAGFYLVQLIRSRTEKQKPPPLATGLNEKETIVKFTGRDSRTSGTEMPLGNPHRVGWGLNIKETEVYELSWAEEKDGEAVFYKWRYFVEAETGRPRKIEKYSSEEANGEYVLRETVIIDYPLDEEVREVIREIYE